MRRLLALAAAALLLSACAPAKGGSNFSGRALTWGTWGAYGRHKAFLDLLEQTYPDIVLEFISYTGGNATGYSWAQMRANDIPDIFISSQILDEDLAKERLVDLSGYDFVNRFSTTVLDQVSIDGGVYLLPVSNAIYGIFYNKTLLEENGWALPTDLAGLEALCEEIRAAGLLPGVVGTQLTGGPFSTVFNLAKTSWLPLRREPPGREISWRETPRRRACGRIPWPTSSGILTLACSTPIRRTGAIRS